MLVSDMEERMDTTELNSWAAFLHAEGRYKDQQRRKAENESKAKRSRRGR